MNVQREATMQQREERADGLGEAQGDGLGVSAVADEQAAEAAEGRQADGEALTNGAAPFDEAPAGEPLRDGSLRSELASIVIVGATSSIARAIADRFAQLEPRARFVLIARRGGELERIASDLRIRREVDAIAVPLDATVGDGVTQLAAALADSPGRLRGLVLTQGFMADQEDAEADAELAQRMIDVNYASVVRLVTELLPLIVPGGFVGVVSSVAGDRGRPSNFIYGSTKAAVDTFLHGLRAKLSQDDRRVSVTIIKPGFTDTAMTYGKPGMFLVAPPERVAEDSVRAIRARKAVLYTPGFWRLIMFIIRQIPRPIFDRMKM